MAKSYFLPADEQGKLKWLNNFAAKLPTYAATVGVTTAEVNDEQVGSWSDIATIGVMG
jgi:hypothetical protein